MLIIIGFLAGMFFVGVQLLQKYGYVSAVNWLVANRTHHILVILVVIIVHSPKRCRHSYSFFCKPGLIVCVGFSFNIVKKVSNKFSQDPG
jgi:hypothetical protein